MCSIIDSEVSIFETFDSHHCRHQCHPRSYPGKFGALGMVKCNRGRWRSSCSQHDSTRSAGAQDDGVDEQEVLMRPTDRTPLVLDAGEEWTSSDTCLAYDSPTVMSSLFVVSLCFTLGGAFLLFFSENILTVLWPSIGLVIIGSSLTVLTVMPGAGRWIVQHIRLIKSSSKVCWLNNLCRECVRNLGKSTTDPVHRMESTGDSR